MVSLYCFLIRYKYSDWQCIAQCFCLHFCMGAAATLPQLFVKSSQLATAPPSSLYSKPRMDAQPRCRNNQEDIRSTDRPYLQPTAPASTVSKPRGFPFRVGAFSASFIESSMDGSVYEEWLSEMAGVDPRHIKDITEGLVCHLLILHRNVR